MRSLHPLGRVLGDSRAGMPPPLWCCLRRKDAQGWLELGVDVSASCGMMTMTIFDRGSDPWSLGA